MNEQAFEMVSLAMRYWFAGLILLAALCALRLALLDRRRARSERKAAPNMEYVGELLVVKGSGDVIRGERYAIQRDIVIGRRRKCDVCLDDHSVFPRHARGELRAGGMLIGAIGSAPVSLRGQPLAQEILVKDGALFCIGAITLQLTLYDVVVEYDAAGEGRAIDAARAGGDEFDEELPFEHDFDDEYGKAVRTASHARPTYDDEADYGADDSYDDEADYGADYAYDNEDDGEGEYDDDYAAAEAAPQIRAKRTRRREREFAPPDVKGDLPDYDPDDYFDDTGAPVKRRGRRS